MRVGSGVREDAGKSYPVAVKNRQSDPQKRETKHQVEGIRSKAERCRSWSLFELLIAGGLVQSEQICQVQIESFQVHRATGCPTSLGNF